MKLTKATIPPIVIATTRSAVATVSRVMPGSLSLYLSLRRELSHRANAMAKSNSDAYCRQAAIKLIVALWAKRSGTSRRSIWTRARPTFSTSSRKETGIPKQYYFREGVDLVLRKHGLLKPKRKP